jgi:predicted ribosome quality control (RQC) complex YloA/Tae2 family protein
MKTVKIDNYTCLVGCNASENWKLLSESNQNYLFFHLSSFPSCYVVLQTADEVDLDIVEKVASLCVQNTRYRNLKSIYVDYTTVKNVAKGDIVGEIYYLSLRKVKKIRIANG